MNPQNFQKSKRIMPAFASFANIKDYCTVKSYVSDPPGEYSDKVVIPEFKHVNGSSAAYTEMSEAHGPIIAVP